MIYRAFAYIGRSSLEQNEVTAFIEAGTRTHAERRLREALGLIWHVGPERVEHYNLADEAELLRQAFGDASTGDARLLETGFSDGRPSYADPDRTLLLLSPRSLRRMVQAQQLAAQLPRTEFAVAA